jgi:hypothetical protein
VFIRTIEPCFYRPFGGRYEIRCKLLAGCRWRLMESVAFWALIRGFSGLERGCVPRRGYTTQPRVLTPGTFRPRKGRRRTRSIPLNVAPKNRDESLADVRAETDAAFIVFLALLGQSIWRPFSTSNPGAPGVFLEGVTE